MCPDDNPNLRAQRALNQDLLQCSLPA